MKIQGEEGLEKLKTKISIASSPFQQPTDLENGDLKHCNFFFAFFVRSLSPSLILSFHMFSRDHDSLTPFLVVDKSDDVPAASMMLIVSSNTLTWIFAAYFRSFVLPYFVRSMDELNTPCPHLRCQVSLSTQWLPKYFAGADGRAASPVQHAREPRSTLCAASRLPKIQTKKGKKKRKESHGAESHKHAFSAGQTHPP